MKTDSELIFELRKYLRELETLLESRLNPSVSPQSKLPFKARVARAALTHRAWDLAASAIEIFEAKRMVPGCILTRSVFETAALLHYLYKSIAKALDSGDMTALDEMLMKAMFGTRNAATSLTTVVNIMTAIEHMDRDQMHAAREYELLCEFAHPNFPGTMGAYSCTDEDFNVTFGRDVGGIPYNVYGYVPLICSLILTIRYHKELVELDSALLSRCDAYKQEP